MPKNHKWVLWQILIFALAFDGAALDQVLQPGGLHVIGV